MLNGGVHESPHVRSRPRSLRRRTVQTPSRVGWAPSGAEGDDWRASASDFVLVARGNRLLDLLPLVPAILKTLPRARPGEAVVVSA